MKRQFWAHHRGWTAIVVLLLASCGSFTNAPTTQEPEALHTAVAQTLAAQASVTAEALPSATHTQVPTGTQIPDDTATLTSQPSPTPSPSATRTPLVLATATPVSVEPSETAQLLYNEDFSGEIGWYEAQEDGFGFQFTEGGYRIYVDLQYASIWSVRQQTYAEVLLEVDAFRSQGAEGAYYGLICRFLDHERYYAGVIGDDGYAALIKYAGGEVEALAAQTDVGAVRSGQSVNRLRLRCDGEDLALAVNGQAVATASDAEYESGDIGLLAATRAEAGLDVLYDNLTVFRP